MASSRDHNGMVWAKFHYNLHHCTPVEVRLLEGQRVSYWDVAIQCSFQLFPPLFWDDLNAFQQTQNVLGIFNYCRISNQFCFTCPGIGRLGDAWRRWFRLRTKGQFLREALTRCILSCPTGRSVYWFLGFCDYRHLEQRTIYYISFSYFGAEILQTNIWKPFLVKFYPPTKLI